MIKYILALLMFLFPIIAFSSGPEEVIEEAPQQNETEYKQSAEDAKFQDDSENCYEEAEKKLKKDSSAKKLSEDEKSDKLEEIFSQCMTAKGHNMNEESSEAAPEAKE